MRRSSPRPVPQATVAALAALVAIVSPGAGCAPSADPETLLAAWFDAVHAEDFVALARVDASSPPDVRRADEGEAPTPFDRWAADVERTIRRYEEERDSGAFAVDPRGLALVRATQLGRGTFWQVVGRETDGDATWLELRLNFGYGEIPYGSLPPGTVVYLLGYPLGTMHAVELGQGRRLRIDVLDHAFVRARLVRDRAARRGEPALRVERLEWSDREPEHAVVDWVF